jgi:hypothetical protein
MRTWGVSEGGGGMTSSMANTRSMENISGQGSSPMARRRNYRETHVGMANGRPHYRYVMAMLHCTVLLAKNIFLCVQCYKPISCTICMYMYMYVCVRMLLRVIVDKARGIWSSFSMLR